MAKYIEIIGSRQGVKEGWDPLSKFLDVSQPEQPFPNVNSREAYQKQNAKHLVKKKTN